MDGPELRSELEKQHAESYGWALCCCARDRSQAEEVLQNAYLKVLQGKARYDGRAAFKTWFFGVIRRTAAEERRRNLLRRMKHGLWRPRVVPAESPADALDRSQAQTLLGRAMQALPPRQYRVLQLVFYHGLSLAETAQVMAISIGSVRTHYARGKESVRRQLQEKSSDETGTGTRLVANVLW
jgi:RNA polymerase sigma-70 factor (ECF subfamily)